MNKDKAEDDTSVRVALRIRPQSAAEKIDMCRVCTTVTPGHPQVVLGKDKAFTFDHVFDTETDQPKVYTSCVENLIEGCFDGYNATVLAYGQTGSGKTYTMGTGFDIIAHSDEEGIIPRAVEHLFHGIEARKLDAKEHNEPQPDFKVMAQFMELYNEDLIDLFDMDHRGKKSHAKIHEDTQGGIYTVGITMKTVQTSQETLKCLHQGAISRTTASTNMNAQSSRSHAIFTLHIKQQRVVKVTEEERKENGSDNAYEYESLSAKFHFVDLAGSERLKRTGATGDRAKEGISINCGLLALGNVISALGDIHKIGSHVPYRDSKLTRLLQDSLGGNSRTLMIACVSPSDRDFMETLNTLKYANRAKNIKNKVVVNQDKASKQISLLRAEIQALTSELLEYRQGKRLSGDGGEQVNDMYHENTMLKTENDKLRLRLKVLHQTMETQSKRITDLVSTQAAAMVNGELEGGVEELIKGYVNEIEEMRNKLLESDAMAAMVMRRPRKSPSSPSQGNILEVAKMDLMRQKRKAKDSSDKSDAKKLEKVSPTDDLGDEEDSSEEESVSEVEDNEDDEEEKEEGEEHAAEEEESSSSSSEDEENNEETIQEDLAELSAEISIKERLIEELELSQNRLNTMKEQYEEKLIILEKKIRETETERDTVLKSINNMDLKAEEKTKKVREEYKKKLSGLEGELKKLQKAKLEHAKLLKAKAANDQKLKRLQQEIGDMKKAKVRLMQQMKLESQKSKMKEIVKDKEIAQLRKERRKYAMHIRDLTTKNQQKDVILKRKQEEVKVLRKQNKPISGKFGKQKGEVTSLPLNATPMETRNEISTQTFSQSTQTATVPRQEAVQAKLVSVTVQSVATSPGPPPKEKWPVPDQKHVTISETPKVDRGSLSTVTSPRSSSSKIPSPHKSPKTPRRKMAAEQSARIAKKMWDGIEKKVSGVIARKQTIAGMASDMERWMTDRDRLSRQLEKCQWKRDEAAKLGKGDHSIKELDEQLEALNAHLEFCQENITDNQNNIMEMEEESDNVDMSEYVAGCTLSEARILLEYFLSKTVTLGQELSNRDILIKEYHNKVEALKENNDLQNDLLQHALQQREEDYYGDNYHGNEDQSPKEGKPIPKLLQDQESITSESSGIETSGLSDDQLKTKIKARRRTATQDELMYPDKGRISREPVIRAIALSSHPVLPLVPVLSSSNSNSSQKPVSAELVQKLLEIEQERKRKRVDDSTTMPPPAELVVQTKGSTSKSEVSVNISRSQSLNMPGGLGNDGYSTLPASFRRGTLKSRSARSFSNSKPLSGSTLSLPGSRSQPSSANSSPALQRKSFGDLEKTRSNSITDGEKADDVFSRLTVNLPHESDPDIGKMLPLKMPSGKPGPLFCAYGASGHNSAVLSLDVTDDMMFTGSKDRTVKVWDLNTCEEISSLSGHKRDVMVVKYSPVTKQIFSVSQNVIKIWDPRQSVGKPIRTLSPCNTLSQLSTFISSMAADSQITDLAISKDGTCLYSALGNNIRVWDLKMFSTVCKLGGHVGPIQSIVLDEGVNTVVYTGSRDHYIKVFDMGPSPSGVQGPSFTFEPPHYDGVQCLALKDNHLFSGSRDNSIKKWSTYKMELSQHMISAHKDWVCALAFLGNGSSSVLLSGCRGGTLKLWKPNPTQMISEIKAHRHPINAIATNSSCVFTASSDRLVRVWRPTNMLNELLDETNRSVEI